MRSRSQLSVAAMPEPYSEARLMEIYHQTVRSLYAYTSRRCGGDRELAEDVTQEAWLRGVREWRAGGIPDQPIAWLTRVARNLLIDLHRQREHVPLEAGSPADVMMAIEQDAIADSAALAAAVNHALARMPKGDAELIEAFHFERRQVAALSITLGVSERTVERRLQQARARLREELERTLTPYGGRA